MSNPLSPSDNRPLDQLKVTELKDELRKRGLSLKGVKKELFERLEEAIRNEELSGIPQGDTSMLGDRAEQEEIHETPDSEGEADHCDKKTEGSTDTDMKSEAPIESAQETQSIVKDLSSNAMDVDTLPDDAEPKKGLDNVLTRQDDIVSSVEGQETPSLTDSSGLNTETCEQERVGNAEGSGEPTNASDPVHHLNPEVLPGKAVSNSNGLLENECSVVDLLPNEFPTEDVSTQSVSPSIKHAEGQNQTEGSGLAFTSSHSEIGEVPLDQEQGSQTLNINEAGCMTQELTPTIDVKTAQSEGASVAAADPVQELLITEEVRETSYVALNEQSTVQSDDAVKLSDKDPSLELTRVDTKIELIEMANASEDLVMSEALDDKSTEIIPDGKGVLDAAEQLAHDGRSFTNYSSSIKQDSEDLHPSLMATDILVEDVKIEPTEHIKVEHIEVELVDKKDESCKPTREHDRPHRRGGEHEQARLDVSKAPKHREDDCRLEGRTSGLLKEAHKDSKEAVSRSFRESEHEKSRHDFSRTQYHAEDHYRVEGRYGKERTEEIKDRDSPYVETKKRKEDERESRQQEPAKRQRRWNSGINSSAELSKPLTTDTVKEITYSDVKDDSPAVAKPSAKIMATSRSTPQAVKGDRVSNGDRIVPPSKRPPTTSLKIDRFVRPFTLKALKDLLAEYGNCIDFWMDQIKTHCYVTYSLVDEAVAARNGLYDRQWPPSFGNLLVAEFVDAHEVKVRLEGGGDAHVTPVTTPRGVPSHTSSSQAAPPAAALHAPIVSLPPPPPLRERQLPPPGKKEPEPAIPTLDDLFKKTKAKPHIYYLPLTNEQVAAKLAAVSKEPQIKNKQAVRS